MKWNVCILVLCLLGPAWADKSANDRVILKDGREVVGKVTKAGNVVTVEFQNEFGGKRKKMFLADQVARIERQGQAESTSARAAPLSKPQSKGVDRKKLGVDYRQQIKPLLQKYCVDCHGGRHTKGGVDFTFFDTIQRVTGDLEMWEDVADSVAFKEMPPEDKKQPSGSESKHLVSWIRQMLETARSEGQTDLLASAPRRLTREEYRYTLIDLLGVDVDVESYLPEDRFGESGFKNESLNLMVPPSLLEKYLMVADKVLVEAGSKLIKKPKRSEIAEVGLAVRRFGARVFRRPITAREAAQFQGLFRSRRKAGDSYEVALRWAYKAMLVSPYFLFRVESLRDAEQPIAVSDYEMATRLSYLLWSSIPDQKLHAAARARRLTNTEGRAREVLRMLKDPKSMRFAEHFGEQWLFGKLEEREPDRVVFPEYSDEIEHAMKRQLVYFLTDLFRRNGSLLEIVDAEHTFLNAELAEYYGIRNVRGSGMQRVSLTDPRRRGLLGMGRVLQRTSMASRTSPTNRGMWVLESLLGTPPPPPPPDVANSIDNPPENSTAVTLREKLTLHAEKGSACRNCHVKMDPIGLALENFDAIGRWRIEEGGEAIDVRGAMPDGRKLEGVKGVREMLMDRQDLIIRNLAERLLTYAIGRELANADRPTVLEIAEFVKQNDYQAHALVLGVVESFPFLHKKR